MDIRTRKARDTRWLYRVENTAFKYNRHANKDRSMIYLRSLGERVWDAEAPAGRRMPTLRASQGYRWGGEWTSYCLGYTDICLARNHRNVLVLLHELTHALGPCLHGPKFVRLYFWLLHRYAGFNRWFLQGVAAERNILLW